MIGAIGQKTAAEGASGDRRVLQGVLFFLNFSLKMRRTGHIMVLILQQTKEATAMTKTIRRLVVKVGTST